MRARLVTLILAAGVTLGGCAYGGGYGGMSVGANYGDPYGYGGYGSPYGYGSQYGSQYGSPYGYAGYGGGYGGYGGYGQDPFSRYNPYYRSPFYGSPYYGSPYMGWYDGYYYPGTGYYIYDRDRKRRRLSDVDRKRWVQGIAEMAATTAARNGQTTSISTSTQSGARIAPSTVTRQAAQRNRGGLATRVRERAARPQARTTERATTRTVRAPAKSSSLGSTLRTRVRASDDD